MAVPDTYIIALRFVFSPTFCNPDLAVNQTFFYQFILSPTDSTVPALPTVVYYVTNISVREL